MIRRLRELARRPLARNILVLYAVRIVGQHHGVLAQRAMSPADNLRLS